MSLKKRARPKEAKSAILAGALLCVGVFEFLEGIEEGVPAPKAAKRAYKRTKIRGRAIRKASAEVADAIREEQGDD